MMTKVAGLEVCIYHFNGTTWGTPTKISGESGYDTYGASVSVSGDYMIIGATFKNSTGSAYIYHYETDTWVLQDIVSPSDGSDWEEFGSSVSITDEYAIVGCAKHNGDAGAAYIYQRNGTDWSSNETKITPSGSKVGYSVSISGNKAAIGTQGNNAAFVYEHNGTSWVQIKQFSGGSDQFGEAVSISGDNVIIGNWGVSSMTGDATIYTHNGGTTWSSQTLTLSGINADDRFGNAVCITGNNAVVGAHYDDPQGNQSGSVSIYTAPPPPLPAISQHPENENICEGSNAVFSITASEVDDYQWLKNGTPLSNGGNISGADTDELTIGSATTDDIGTYSCTVSNSVGDITSNEATLNVDVLIESSAGSTQNICSNTSTLEANDPTPGTGEWFTVSGSVEYNDDSDPTTIISNIALGLNTLRWTIYNGACTSESVVEIYNDLPSVADAGDDQSVCENTTYLEGNTPVLGTGTWSTNGNATITDINDPNPEVTNLDVGDNIFTWEIANSTCETSSDDVIINYENVVADFDATPETQTWPNSTVFIENNSADTYISYHWEFGNGDALIQNEYLEYFEYSYFDYGFGTYTITLTVTGDNCDASTEQTITILDEVNIKTTENSLLQIFPNPSNGIFTINFNSQIQNLTNSQIVIANINGQVIYKSNINSKTINTIDLSNYPSGIYILKLISEDENIYRKIIIE